MMSTKKILQMLGVMVFGLTATTVNACRYRDFYYCHTCETLCHGYCCEKGVAPSSPPVFSAPTPVPTPQVLEMTVEETALGSPSNLKREDYGYKDTYAEGEQRAPKRRRVITEAMEEEDRF